MNPLDRAIEIVGSVSKLAELMGITPQAIYKAKRTGARLDPDNAQKIEELTYGKVTKESLVWPPKRAA